MFLLRPDQFVYFLYYQIASRGVVLLEVALDRFALPTENLTASPITKILCTSQKMYNEVVGCAPIYE